MYNPRTQPEPLKGPLLSFRYVKLKWIIPSGRLSPKHLVLCLAPLGLNGFLSGIALAIPLTSPLIIPNVTLPPNFQCCLPFVAPICKGGRGIVKPRPQTTLTMMAMPTLTLPPKLSCCLQFIAPIWKERRGISKPRLQTTLTTEQRPKALTN